MRLLIAIEDNKGTDSRLSMHFGHCPFFAIYDTETEKLDIIENKLDHSNQNITPVEQIIELEIDAVFSLGIGQRAISLFNEKGVKLKTGDFKVVKEVIKNIDSLRDLKDGCNHWTVFQQII